MKISNINFGGKCLMFVSRASAVAALLWLRSTASMLCFPNTQLAVLQHRCIAVKAERFLLRRAFRLWAVHVLAGRYNRCEPCSWVACVRALREYRFGLYLQELVWKWHCLVLPRWARR